MSLMLVVHVAMMSLSTMTATPAANCWPIVCNQHLHRHHQCLALFSMPSKLFVCPLFSLHLNHTLNGFGIGACNIDIYIIHWYRFNSNKTKNIHTIQLFRIYTRIYSNISHKFNSIRFVFFNLFDFFFILFIR